MRCRILTCCLVLVAGSMLFRAEPGCAQVNTANLSGQVLDPSGRTVAGARVTVKKLDTGVARSNQADEAGAYSFIGLVPGGYEMTVEAPGFARYRNSGLTLSIGQSAQFNPTLEIEKRSGEVVNVTAEAQLVETRATAVSQTVSTLQINELPINGRNYVNFTLLNSQAARDSAPSIGAAPTSGLNFGGQRARGNQVSVDGADAVDSSTNGIRSTVSQEDVQEFQLIISNYMPEFGRATGGVVNIVTKSGSNQVHGDVFGFLRSKYLQARNPFSVQVDPTTGTAEPIKQGYTRVQAGATLGGPIQKDRTFYFLSYEITRRNETGFTNIGADNFGLVPTQTPFFPGPLLLTPDQAAFVSNPAVLSAPGGAQFAAGVAFLAGSASNVALNGIDYGAVSTGEGVPTPPGPRFPLPIDCGVFNPSAPCAPGDLVPLPGSYVPLKSLIGNYPIFEGTSLYSVRLDHYWNDQNSTFVRVNASPSLQTGIQVNAQNENFGQNAGSRTSLQQYRDVAGVVQHTTSFGGSMINEARFQFARRGLHYGFSQLPGGSGPGVNITGFAFFGREPFSTVDRVERRWQFTDDFSWTKGRHIFKFGGDTNLIQLYTKTSQIFELNFGGVYDFGSLAASDLGLPSSFNGVTVPGMTAVQSYGLGLPNVFIQGIGNSNRPFHNTALAGFAQDSWKINPHVTLNYGVRYDVELTPVFTPATPLNIAAEKAYGVLQGIPRDTNNFAPRLALAWDPKGNGTTVIRAGYGFFFDHPLLAVAFDSNTAEGAESSQLLAGGGAPTRASVLTNPTGALNAASIFQGVLNAIPSMGYLSNQQRFDPLFPNSLFTNQNFMPSAANPFGFPLPLLPFTLPTAKNFVYSYAEQGNFTIEHSFANDYKISASYSYTRGLHLNRPRNTNVANAVLLTNNFRNALAAGLTPSTPLSVQAPSGNVAPAAGSCGVAAVAPGALGALFGCPGPLAALNGQFIGTAAFFNFFRPSGPNPSFAGAVPGGYATEVALASTAGYPVGVSGVQVPWSDIDQQESSGDSVYHGLTVTVSKRFAQHFELVSGWTWSHAIDDSTDLQTLLTPQDSRYPGRERSNSTFDQRHRWITSAVFTSPFSHADSGFGHKFLADFTVAPVLEFSSGRPFTVLTGTDYALQFSSNTVRPSVGPAGVQSPYIPGVYFTLPTVCDQAVSLGPNSISPPLGCTGNLGRNAFTRPGFAQFDLRISRRFPIHERWSVEAIADAFNLFNRFNVGDVNPLCDPTSASACLAGQPTAALDPRTFQLALKIIW